MGSIRLLNNRVCLTQRRQNELVLCARGIPRADFQQIELLQQGENRFLIKTPFRFEDGDHFTVVLKQALNSWVLTDEANTIMHLSYWLDTDVLEVEGNRKQIVDSALSMFSVEMRDGELVLPVIENRFGDALFRLLSRHSPR